MISTSAKPKLQREAVACSHRPLQGFGIAFGLALASGFYYYLVPHDANWTVSQVAMGLHIAAGFLTLAFFLSFVIAHQREKEGSPLFLVAPWLARRQPEKEPWRYRQRLLGHALSWSIAVLFLSGLLVSAPGMLWLANIVWVPDYLVYQAGNAVHLGITFVAAGIAGLHLGRQRNGRKVNR